MQHVELDTMTLGRTHSYDNQRARLSRRDKSQATAHPGFMAISPRSSSAHTDSDESRRSESPSGFIHNLMAPLSSHLLSSGFTNSPLSKDHSKPSTGRSRSGLHQKCVNSKQSDFSRMPAPPTIRNRSKPCTPTSRPSSRTETHSPVGNYQRSRPSSQSDSHCPLANYQRSRPSSRSDLYSPLVNYQGSRPSSQSNQFQPASYQDPQPFSRSASPLNTGYNSRPSSQQQDYTEHAISYQINMLREKYSKLKEDYNAKVEEVSTTRVELESAIRDAVEKHQRCEVAEQKAADLILRIKEAESEKIKYSSSRDRIQEMENQLTISKHKHNEGMDDVDEARKILEQQREAVDNMRQLYLETEQLAEEQSRKLGTLESENERLTEQIALSMDQAREHFNVQVFELGPLADSVSRLNESIIINKEKKHKADKKAESVQNEIADLVSRNEELKVELSKMKEMATRKDQEKIHLRQTIDRKQEERAEAKAENYALRAKIKDLEELNGDKEMKISVRSGEAKDLATRLETLREECARQISSNKNTMSNARKSCLKRLTALEKELAKTKADENEAEKERDEIRLRLEDQIASLSQNLSQAQEKIWSLQDSLGYINKDRNVRVRRVNNSHSLL